LQHTRGISIHLRMRLEDTDLLDGDRGVEAVADSILHEVGEELAFTVRERNELEPAPQTLKAWPGVGGRRQLKPAFHEAGDVGGVERQLASTERVDQCAARRIEVTVVTGVELVVLVLLDPLAVAPARPQVLHGDGGSSGLQERSQPWGMASAEVQD